MTGAQDEKNSVIFEEVWDGANSRINELSEDQIEQNFLKSLVMGGTVAAETVVSNTSAQQFWGEGNKTWANEISQLFSFLMLSQCYRWVADKPEAGKSPIPKETSAAKLIFAFGSEPEQSLDDFLKFDSQFNYDLDKKPHIVHTSTLLLAKICEITGHKCLEWKQIKFPVAELTHLVKKGVIIDSTPMRSQEDINNVTNGIVSGLEAMNKFHESCQSLEK